MKLRDLFRRRAVPPDTPDSPDSPVPPDAPVPVPARRPDWPTMQPVQRVVSSSDLITAPDRFPDALVSWQNPSSTGTLGHYVTPDAPAGVSDGFAAASPRGELPAPAQPWWWPAPAVQRRVPTPTLTSGTAPASARDDEPVAPPAVPVHPLTAPSFVSAAGIEPPPRLALPAVQRHAVEPGDNESPVAEPDLREPDLPASEPPPENLLPSVAAHRFETPEASAGSSPGSGLDLPVARRLGLGAPLQRIPDAGDEPPVGSAVAHRLVEVDAGPMDVAPLVSDSAPIPSVAPNLSPASPSAAGSGPAGSSSSPAVHALRVQPVADSPLESRRSPVAEFDISAVRDRTNELGGLTAPQPVEESPGELTAATPHPAPMGIPDPMVQRQANNDADSDGASRSENKPRDAAPLVSGSPPIASAVTAEPIPPAGASSSPGPGSSVESTTWSSPVQRAVDATLPPRPHPASAVEPTLTPQERTATVQLQTHVGAQPPQVAPLVSDSAPIASMPSPSPASPRAPLAAGPEPNGSSSLPGPSPAVPALRIQRVVDPPLGSGSLRLGGLTASQPAQESSGELTAAAPHPAAAGIPEPTVQRQIHDSKTSSDTDGESGSGNSGDGEQLTVAPLLSDSSPIASMVPAEPIPPTPPAVAGSASAGPSSSIESTTWSSPGQRAVDAALAPRQNPALTAEPTLTRDAPAPQERPSTVQRQVDARARPPEVAPLVSDSAPMASVQSPSPASPSARSASQVEVSSGDLSAVTSHPAPMRVPQSTVQRQVDGDSDSDGEPVDVAPLLSDSPPIASTVLAEPIPPATPPVAGSGPAGPGSVIESASWPSHVQRAVETALPFGPNPGMGAEPTSMPDAPAPEGVPPAVQRQVAVGAPPLQVAPLVSDSAPMASVQSPSPASPSARSAAESGSSAPSSLPEPSSWSAVPGLGIQRVVDASLQSVSSPVAEFDSSAFGDRTHNTAVELGGLRAQPVEVWGGLNAATPAPAPAGVAHPTVQRQTAADTVGDDGSEPMDVAPLVSDSPPIASTGLAAPAIPPAAGSGPAGPVSSIESASWPSHVQRALEAALPPEPGRTAEPTLTSVAPAPASRPSTVQRQAEIPAGVDAIEVAPLVSDLSLMALQSGLQPGASPPERAQPEGSPPGELTAATPLPAPAGAARSTVQRWADVEAQTVEAPAIEVQPMDVAPLLPDASPMASIAISAPRMPLPAASAAPPAPAEIAPSTVQRQVAGSVGSRDVAPLVSDSPPLASMASVAVSRMPSEPGSEVRRPDEPALPLQRTTPQRESAETPPAMAAEARGTVAFDSPASAIVGLIGDRAIEPIATDYAAAADSAGVPGSASTLEQSRWTSVQRQAPGGAQVRGTHMSAPRVLATTAVQRSVGTGTQPAASWPPDALGGTSSGVDQPTRPVQFTQFVAAAPAVTHTPAQPTTEVVVQRVESEPAVTTDPVAATGPATVTGAATGTGPAGIQPALPTGSTSPTEVDKLARRLYDPIARRLKAELQLDRERAGRSLDLWH